MWTGCCVAEVPVRGEGVPFPDERRLRLTRGVDGVVIVWNVSVR